MKWQNKGHEFDDLASKYIDIFCRKNNCIYVFGAGVHGQNMVSILDGYHCFERYIDNDERKQEQGVAGKDVISFQDYLEQYKKGIIVIAADEKNIPEIEQQIQRAGLEYGKDFWVHTEFMQEVFPILSLYYFDILYMDLAQICLTERCTLKCRDCAHGCFAVDMDKEDMSLELVKESADIFFSKVDLIREFVLIGGEPFLYKDLELVIEYIGKKYRDKMIVYSITTNGTIRPRETILDLCKEYNVLINISNYSGTVKRLEEQYRQLTEYLGSHQVSYTIGNEQLQWMDYGFQTMDRGGKEEELVRVFDECRTLCREVRGNKYYYCVMARSASENLGMNVGENDYLDLNTLGENEKKKILEFNHGYSEKGYIDMCNHCHGAEAIKYPIPAAIQKTVSKITRGLI